MKEEVPDSRMKEENPGNRMREEYQGNNADHGDYDSADHGKSGIRNNCGGREPGENRIIPAPQEIYRHFKGKYYQIVTMAEDTETGAKLVIYQALYGDFRIWARELSDFTAQLDPARYPGADQKHRFERVERPGELPADSLDKKPDEQPGNPRGRQPRDAEIDLQGNLSGSQPLDADNSYAETFRTTPHRADAKVAGSSGKEAGDSEKESGAADEGDFALDPLVEQFLDADSNEERLNILSAIRPRVTNDMIDVCAMAVGVEIDGGDPLERWQELRDCLLTIGHYEQSRSRFNG